MSKVTYILFLVLFVFANQALAQKGKTQATQKVKDAIERALDAKVFVHITANKNPFVDVQAPVGSAFRDSEFVKKQVGLLSYLKSDGKVNVVQVVRSPEAPGWIRDSLFVAIVKLPKSISRNQRSQLDIMKGYAKTSPIARITSPGDVPGRKITSPGDVPLFKMVKGQESEFALIPLVRTNTGLKVCACTGGGSDGDPPTRY